jgi:hypothetical protein
MPSVYIKICYRKEEAIERERRSAAKYQLRFPDNRDGYQWL